MPDASSDSTATDPASHRPAGRWQFWIDRGGTFTDVVARKPDGSVVTHKLLSENPRQYCDAAVQGIRELLGVAADEVIPAEDIEAVKMGTTVATNALLEREGEPTLLITTAGFGDALRIGYQTRPQLFALRVELPPMLYSEVLEVHERLGAHGELVQVLDEELARRELEAAHDRGLRAAAICLMHGYRYPEHEQRLAALAAEVGFTQISVSHSVSPLMKLIPRGDTTVVDAYLSPILRRYVAQVSGELGGCSKNASRSESSTRLMFMQSNGGLIDANFFEGKDAILSGPAGGVVGMLRTAGHAGFDKLIGFDMGGTSTDVSHYAGELERALETEVAGVRLRAPMMLIHTVAAGGGSVLHFDGGRYRVGPDSAGADPGPACYRNGGPLTVTDCNVMLGKLQPAHFPRVFGANGDQPLDAGIVHEKFAALAENIRAASDDRRTPQQVAEGFLAIAVDNMANAIKKISTQRGYDVSDYALCCFGGAGGQHACLVADALGMGTVFLHPHAGVLSAFGMGLADARLLRQRAVEAALDEALLGELRGALVELEADGRAEMRAQQIPAGRISAQHRLMLRYAGSDTALEIPFGELAQIVADFESAHRARFGFVAPDKALIVESLQVEVIGAGEPPNLSATAELPMSMPEPLAHHPVQMAGEIRDTAFFDRDALPADRPVTGPAVLIERTGTVVVEPGWQAVRTAADNLLLRRVEALPARVRLGTGADPVMLEIFNNLFMSIAEQMGSVLENTAASVNIKERLDFSCAVFDAAGDLIANAPHMPVHLGSMSESIKAVIRQNAGRIRAGDAFMLNAPYNGGTHLPDVTVVRPVFDEAGSQLLLFVAARGHHADIGGRTPGSMPPDSTHIEEEGVVIDNFKVVDAGHFREPELRELLASGAYPARNPDTNIADFQAQLAACEMGARALWQMIEHFGLEVVQAYMQHVQDNAEACVRRVLGALSDGDFRYQLDDGSAVQVSIRVDRAAQRALIDFSGTSEQHAGNYNAPAAVARAAVLYVFRCLVDDDIPLNEGCLKPLQIVIPEGSMINPRYPAAVVAGNVETSQVIVDALLGALGAVAASQGTMNNITWGNARHQYYETLCGGTGAGADFDGTDAVHSHMTNSRLTDPEVLEWRYPVRLEEFRIRDASGGAGRHHGGSGVIRRLRFLEAMTANILANRRRVPPYGLAGGDPGQPGRNWVERVDGRIEALSAQARVEVRAGDCLVVETPGGGGYGEAERE